jgi:putative nucleotidyltransferase with HDIG domain
MEVRSTLKQRKEKAQLSLFNFPLNNIMLETEANLKRRILFVDDEPKVLISIRRMLHGMRKEWDMQFAESGHEALSMLAEEPFDVIVTDMRMPGIDGAQLLSEVKKAYPNVVRIVLSGHSDKEMIFKSVRLAHQYLAKPCDANLLKSTVSRACALRELLAQESLKNLVSAMDSLPSLPSLYAEIMDELRNENSSMQKIGEIISSDLGMTTKILQLVNSAFFGIPRYIEKPVHAVNLLGLDTVRALVLSVEVFSEFEQNKLEAFDIESLWNHSIMTGELAKQIAKTEEADKQMINDAYMAGLLHDVGKLILVDHFPDEQRDIIELVKKENIPLNDSETRVLGAGHAEVGGYLLGLWGMTDPIVEAVAFHHNPQICPIQTFSPLTAVHVADALDSPSYNADKQASAEHSIMDAEYIGRIGLTERIPLWQDTYALIVQEEKINDSANPFCR